VGIKDFEGAGVGLGIRAKYGFVILTFETLRVGGEDEATDVVGSGDSVCGSG
jgi:hypothetical protein